MQIITTAIIKGGTGKTTTTAALAQAGAAAGKKILAIDLDPQGNLTAALGADPGQPGSYELLNGTPAAQVVQEVPQGATVIAGSTNLAAITTRAGSAHRLREALEPIKGAFDLIVIDTPPQMGELTFNALQASTGLIIPLETDTSSLQGLYNIAGIVQQIQRTNPALTVKGVIITRYDGRAKLNRYIKESIEKAAAKAGIPYLTEIRAGIAAREAVAMRESLFSYAPGSKPAQDYKKLYDLIMQEG